MSRGDVVSDDLTDEMDGLFRLLGYIGLHLQGSRPGGGQEYPMPGTPQPEHFPAELWAADQRACIFAPGS